jgi:hypothetical protein
MRCAELSLQAAEPLAGTSATATAWLCIEQPGPWGADVVRDGTLGVGDELHHRTRACPVDLGGPMR